MSTAHTSEDAEMRVAVTHRQRIASLFEAESLGLLGYFLRRVENREDAADLLAETALTLWRRALDVPLDPTEARMWAYGVARRTLLTNRRSDSRRTALAGRLRQDLLSRAPHTEHERFDDVHAAILSLQPRDRELIGLIHWEGFSVAQAAELLGIRAGAAQMRYSRARGRLKAILG
jgi:RNA polymerase sigma-70 factor (ECF subfamily)